MRQDDPNLAQFDVLFESIENDDIDTVKSKITELNTQLLLAHEGMKHHIGPERFIKVLLKHLDNKFDSALMLQCSN